VLPSAHAGAEQTTAAARTGAAAGAAMLLGARATAVAMVTAVPVTSATRVRRLLMAAPDPSMTCPILHIFTVMNSNIKDS